MTERSSFLSDGGTDGSALSAPQARLTRDDLAQFPDLHMPWRPLAGATDDDHGVFKRHLGELSASVDGDELELSTGRGLCDGTLYENDATVLLKPDVPTGGTTGGLVVLRKDWLERTVRLALHQSADGTADAPTPRQEPGTIWETPLWAYSITTGGVISVTGDRRSFLRTTDLETVFRAFVEDGGYAYSRLGGWGGTTIPGPGDKVGLGWELVADAGAGLAGSPTVTVLRGAWDFATGVNDDADCGITGPQHARTTQDWIGIFSLVPPSGTDRQIVAGLQASMNQFIDGDDQVGFRVVDGGVITAYADAGGSESQLPSGVTPDGSTRHVLTLAIGGGGSFADFWIDGVPLGRLTTLPSGSTDLYGQLGIRTTAAANDQSLVVGEAVLFARAG